MLILKRTGITAGLIALLLFAPVSTLQAAEVDFSCMSYKVWPKRHLSHRYREFDIVLQNHCPGPVYWSMCIERIDAKTLSVWETLKPAGYIETEKKARVNLQAQKNEGTSTFRRRFEEFYVNIGYAVDSASSADCFATQCEASKRDLRAAIKANEVAWEKSENAVVVQIASECPDEGWDPAGWQDCSVRIRESGESRMEQFALKDTELRENMAAVDPDRCTTSSGALVPTD